MKQSICHIIGTMLMLCMSVACSLEFKAGTEVSDSDMQSIKRAVTVQELTPTPEPATPAAIPVAMPAAPAAEPTGTLAATSVRKTESRHHGELKFCFEQEPSSKATSLRVELVVNPKGSVEKVDVLERSDISERLETCLIQAVKRWSFEKPSGGSARASLLLKR